MVAERGMNMQRKQIGELEKAYRGKRMAAKGTAGSITVTEWRLRLQRVLHVPE